MRRRVGEAFDLRLTLCGHGWIDLAPFSFDAESGVMAVAVPLGARGAADVEVSHRGRDLHLRVRSPRTLSSTRRAALRQQLLRMLRLDIDLAPFWSLCAEEPRLAWVARRQAGRILRGATAFEDLMKLLFTTNCSWAATRLMTQRLVDALGAKAPSGRRAFPTPAACASEDEGFYRDTVRAGYRARFCRQLAEGFASGALDEERWTAPGLPVEVVRDRLLALPGFGRYAAGQALRLFGYYEDLALDSWCRARLAAETPDGQPPTDAAVQATYAAFAPYDGLAMWMDLTAAWHGEDPGEAAD